MQNIKVHQVALSKSIKEWTRLRNRASIQEDWCICNAYLKLCEALKKQNTIDIAMWEHIAVELNNTQNQNMGG